MSVVDTTNIIDNSIFLKAKLTSNMVGENYYIENLQDKRNQDWEYRYNRVEIEEELNKQVVYANEEPCYTPIDAVITSVKGEKGEDLGTDWASLSFRELKHPNQVGSRYRFSLDFPDMKGMNEEEKKYGTSVWLAINKSPIKAGNSCMVRRCNATLPILGYENRDRRKTKTREIHMEPVILTTELRYLQVYANQTVPVPQAEWYITTQLNYFTNSIKINDRFLFGVMDSEVRENNSAYKVKAVIKTNTFNTFVKDNVSALEQTPLLVLALDKDAIAPQDNFKTGIANNNSIYLIPSKKEQTQIDSVVEVPDPTEPTIITEKVYTLKDSSPVEDTILLGHKQSYELTLLCDGTIVPRTEATFSFEKVLENKESAQYDKYFKFEEYTSGIAHGFTVTNLKPWQGGKLHITATYTVPDTTKVVGRHYYITLGKSY